MDTHKNKFAPFIVMVLGGPHNYTGRDMRTAHAHLKVTEEAFNAVGGHVVGEA